MTELTDGRPFGILRGPSRRGAGMDVVTAAMEAPPVRGDFAIVPTGSDEALVFRIAGAYPSGSFAEYSDRGADYLAQLARREIDAGVPDRVRDLLLRFRLEVVPLGRLCKADPWRFEAGVRALQVFGEAVYRPSEELLKYLVNVGLEGEPEDQVVRIGVLSRGHEVVEHVPVNFSIRRLKGRRSFVFARAGYGKSNLVKLLLSRLYASPPDVGLLIIDPEGEYAFQQESEKGRPIPGLLDHPSIRDRVIVYTARDKRQFPPSARERVAGKVRLDLASVTPDEFLASFVAQEKLGQVWANYLRSAESGRWERLVRLLDQFGYQATDQQIAESLGVRSRPGKDGDVKLAAIRNNVIPVLRRLHDPESRLLQQTKQHLLGQGPSRQPGVVVLDVSAMPHHDADAIIRVVMNRLFRSRVDAFTDGPTRSNKGILLVLEEAQSVLGARRLDDQDIYVRWVKEGRKYGLGALLITQQPSSVSQELVSQGDNFFVMHLLSEMDLKTLGAANAYYTPEVLEFIRNEPVKGNCYFWSAPDQPYVVAARIDNYEERVREEIPIELSEHDIIQYIEPGYEDQLIESIVKSLCEVPRIYLFVPRRIDTEAVQGLVAAAATYLESRIVGAEALLDQQPNDWETRHGWTCIKGRVLDKVLAEHGLSEHPRRALAKVFGADREMVVLREERLRELAERYKIRVKSLRPDELNLYSKT